MPIGIIELLTRPRHGKVRGLVCKLLTDGLGARSADISFKHQTFEVRGRIDALLGSTGRELVPYARARRELATLWVGSRGIRRCRSSGSC